MARSSKQVWVKRVEEWARRGGSAKEFAAELGVSPRTLVYWKWRLGKEAQGNACAPAHRSRRRAHAFSFIEVTSQQPSRASVSYIEIAIGDRLVVRVFDGFDAAMLRRVLEVVEQRG
jgi:hypothetical protein